MNFMQIYTLIQDHSWLPISVKQPIYRYRKFDFSISVIQNDFPISVNRAIYRYRKLELPISGNNYDLPISEIRISDIDKSNFRYQ